MKRFVAVMLYGGNIEVGTGVNVAEAFCTPTGIDFYMEVEDQITVATRRKFNRIHDVVIHYAYHKTVGYVIAAVTPYSFDYPELPGCTFTTKEEMIEAVLKFLEEQGWKL